MQRGKVVVQGGLTNGWEKKRSERQKRKGKICPAKYRVPENNKEIKKDFLSEQCKEIEENNRMGKMRDFFKKIGTATKKFHAKTDTIKDKNSKDLTEAEDIKKSWQEYRKIIPKKKKS